MRVKGALLLFLVVGTIYGQIKKDEYVNDNFLRFEDHIYKSNIRTVQLHESSFEMNQPMLDFYSDQTLKLSFDDMDGGNKTYQITFYHCDAGWKQDDLMVSEYINGFYDDQVNNRSTSFNTVALYSHYVYSFPNTSVKFSKSGNYVLLVYENGNKEEPVLTRRFVLYENLINIGATVHQPLGSDKLYNMHEVDFSLFYNKYQVTNPFTDLKVVITQNNHWESAITDLKPVFVKDNELTFDFDDGTNCFDSGNEFRHVDIKSTKYPADNTASLFRDSVSKIFQAYLRKDEARTFKRYVNIRDINGRQLIKANEVSNSEIEGDYFWVHFFLSYDVPLADGNLYVMGNFNNWKNSKENKMIYNAARKGYECSMYLKQGYYDYQYIFYRDGDNKGDVTQIEGNQAQADNDYTIFIYHRTNGQFFDRLIAVKNLNSVRN